MKASTLIDNSRRFSLNSIISRPSSCCSAQSLEQPQKWGWGHREFSGHTRFETKQDFVVAVLRSIPADSKHSLISNLASRKRFYVETTFQSKIFSTFLDPICILHYCYQLRSPEIKLFSACLFSRISYSISNVLFEPISIWLWISLTWTVKKIVHCVAKNRLLLNILRFPKKSVVYKIVMI